MVACCVYFLFYVENTEALFQQANGVCWVGVNGVTMCPQALANYKYCNSSIVNTRYNVFLISNFLLQLNGK